MGISARLRYAISWLITKVLVNVVAWVTAGLLLVSTGVTLFALWFSPELRQHETIRLLKRLADEGEDEL